MFSWKGAITDCADRRQKWHYLVQFTVPTSKQGVLLTAATTPGVSLRVDFCRSCCTLEKGRTHEAAVVMLLALCKH